MGTFDAGTIEAKLILDRSDFDRKLREAQGMAEKFESTDAEKKVTVDADTLTAEEKIKRLEAQIKRIEASKAKIEVDDAAADAKIEKLRAKIEKIRSADAEVKITADADDAKADIAEVEAGLKALPERKKIFVDVRTGNGVSRTQAMVTAILAGLPLIPAVAAPATAAIVGLAGSLTAAAAGAGVLTLGLIGAIQKFNDIKDAGGQMNPQMMMFANALDAVKKAYDGFVSATQNRAFELMASGLNLVAAILPKLVPIFNAFADVASRALTDVGNWFQGPQGTAMLRWFQTFGALQFGHILNILGNLGQVIINLMQAFSPFAESMMSGLENLTAGWVTWSQTIASNQGFQQFIAYAKENGPLLLATLGNLVDAIINIGVALAPLGTLLLGLINDFANFIAGMNPTALGIVLTTVIALVAAWTTFEAIMSTVRAGMALYSAAVAAVRAATVAWTVAQWALNVALTANPIGIVIVALAALGAALYLLWTRSENFRTTWINNWNWIKNTTAAVLDWLMGKLRLWNEQFFQGWNQIVAFLTTVGTAINNAVRGAWNSVFAFMSNILSNIRNAVVNGWNAVRNAVVSAGSAIRNAVVSAWNAVRNAVVSAGNAIRSAVVSAWNSVRAAVVNAMNTIRSNVVSAWNSIRSAVVSAGSSIRSFLVSTWNSIRSAIASAVNSIRSAVSSGFNAARSAAVSAFNALRSGVQSALNGVRSAVSSAVGAIKGFFAGAGSWLWNAGWSIISGLISGIQSGIGRLGSVLGGIGGFIASHKGPPSYDRVMLEPHGRMIMGGLINGLEGMLPRLGGALNRITGRIEGIGPNMRSPVLGGGSSAGGGVTVHQNIYYPVAEPSSVATTRNMKELAVLGVFG